MPEIFDVQMSKLGDKCKDLEEAIMLLPHHIGLFTSFFFSDDSGREEYLSNGKNAGYSDYLIANEKEKFYAILNNPKSTITVSILKPDSICQPETDKQCKACFEDKRPHYPDRVKRMQRDKLYREFVHGVGLLSEINTLLYYDPLKPATDYKSQYFKQVVNCTGEKIRYLLGSDSYLVKMGICPLTLIYKYSGYEKESARQFPVVAKFETSEIWKLIVDPYILDSIVGDKQISDENIEELIQRFPFVFSQDSVAAYDGVMSIINK